MAANWSDDLYERDRERDWAKYSKPDPESAEEREARLVEEERVQGASTGGVSKK